MYVDPMEEEGLFLLEPEKRDDDNVDLDTLKTERDLEFEFKPNVDYWKKFDAMLPAWTVRPYVERQDSSAAFFTTKGAPEVKVGRRRTQVVSLRKYVRAIDPAGNLCQLTVSTVPPSPEFRNGDDNIGTQARVIAQKSRRGWIVVENEVTCWNVYAGKSGQQYAAWALAVMAYRKAKHAAHQVEERKHSMTFIEQEAKKQTEAMRSMGTEIARAVVELTNGGQGGGPLPTGSPRARRGTIAE